MALLLVIAPSPGRAEQSLVVFAGSAAQPPLEEAAEVFQAKTGVQVILHLGGSGAMLNQVRLSGQGDLYIPGSHDYLEKAVEFGLTTGEPTILAYLVPAILVAEGNPLGIQGLSDLGRADLRVGLADPDGVCVGLYAIEILDANSLLDTTRQNLYGMVESCAKAASLIPLNLVDAVLGWREFAAWNPDVMDAVIPASDQIPRLAYIPATVLRGAKNPQAANAFIDFLVAHEGQEIFRDWGYLMDESEARQFAPNARIGGFYTLPEGW